MAERYSFSLTTFSPSGKLAQIEYALAAVAQGFTSVGIKATNGVVIATEKKAPSPLVDDSVLERVAALDGRTGSVGSGLGPDARVLIDKGRKAAAEYERVYGEGPRVGVIVRELATLMQEYTQSGGVRPFGVSLLVTGVGEGGPALYQVDPSGSSWPWLAAAIGRNMVNAKAFLEKRYSPELELEDAIHTAILALKEGFDGGELGAQNLEIGVLAAETGAFKKLSDNEIRDYLANL